MTTVKIQELTHANFAEVGIPYGVFYSESKNLIAIASSQNHQWAAIDIGSVYDCVHLYDRRSLKLVGHFKSRFKINALVFCPKEECIVIGTGSYDGGMFFEGELLFWDCENEPRSLFEFPREVIALEFMNEGKTLAFEINPTDDLTCEDFTIQRYELPFSFDLSFTIAELTPISKREFEWANASSEDPSKRLREFTSYEPNHSVWNIAFISSSQFAVGRNDGIIELFDLDGGNSKEVKISEEGDCVEVLFSAPSSCLWVNVWKGFRKSGEHEIYSLSLPDLQILKRLRGSYSLSINKEGYLLARNTESGEDKFLDSSFEPIWNRNLGGYDLFNHHIRIDNSDALYYLAGDLAQPHLNKSIFSYVPGAKKPSLYYRLEDETTQMNSVRGIAYREDLILSAAIYRSEKYDYGTQILFRIGAQKRKWEVVVDDSVIAIEIFNQLIFVLKREGGLEWFELESGQSLGRMNLREYGYHSPPMSLACDSATMIIGLRNGRVIKVIF